MLQLLAVEHHGAEAFVGPQQCDLLAAGLQAHDLSGEGLERLFLVGQRCPMGRQQVGAHQSGQQRDGKRAMVVAEEFGHGRVRAFLVQPAQQHPGVLGGNHCSRRGHRHHVHRPLAGGEVEQHKLRDQPYTEKQQEGVAAQLFAKVPQAQIGQQVPRQEGFGQFSQVVVKGFVMSGFNKGAAKTANAVGQQQFADGLHAAALIEHAQPDRQRDQPQ